MAAPARHRTRHAAETSGPLPVPTAVAEAAARARAALAGEPTTTRIPTRITDDRRRRRRDRPARRA